MSHPFNPPLAALLVALVLATGCGRRDAEPGPPAAAPAADTTIHFSGFGPVRAGMTVAAAAAALGDSLPLLGPKMDPCYYVSHPRRPDVAFMVIGDQIARVDVRQGSRLLTAAGAGIGDTEERIRSLYAGRIEIEPHRYVDGSYLIVRPEAEADTSFRIVFETDGRRVTRYRAGRLPEVRWVEGCS